MADENRLEIVLVEGPSLRPAAGQTPPPAASRLPEAKQPGTDGATAHDPRRLRRQDRLLEIPDSAADEARRQIAQEKRRMEVEHARRELELKDPVLGPKRREEAAAQEEAKTRQLEEEKRGRIRALIFGFADLNTAVRSNAGIISRTMSMWGAMQRIGHGLGGGKGLPQRAVGLAARTLGSRSAGSNMAGLTGGIGKLGMVAGAATAGVVGLVVGVRRWADQATAVADKLSSYSGELATAQAQAQVRRIEGDIRRAQLLGPMLAQHVEARSRIEQSWEDFKARMMNTVLPILVAMEKAVAYILENLRAIANFITDALNTIIEGIETAINFLPGVQVQLGRIAKNTEKPPTDEQKNFMKQFLEMAAPGKAMAQARRRNKEAGRDPVADIIARFPLPGVFAVP